MSSVFPRILTLLAFLFIALCASNLASARPAWNDPDALIGKAIWCERPNQWGMGASFWVMKGSQAYYYNHNVGYKKVKIAGVWREIKPYRKGQDVSGESQYRVKLSPEWLIFMRTILKRDTLELYRHKKGYVISKPPPDPISLKKEYKKIADCFLTTVDDVNRRVQPQLDHANKLYREKVKRIRSQTSEKTKNNKL